MPFLKDIRSTLEMIKWEHSIFALPFALCGAMLAARGWPTGRQIFWIVVCMVSARSAAMAFNRLADANSYLQNGMPDCINDNSGSDVDQIGFGGAVLFLNWLTTRFGYSYRQVTQHGADTLT